jgi:multisubunit Na+/H+ antiporter MnhB subunit
MKKLLATGCWLLAAGVCFAQEPVEMADELRSSGKIYVVVGVLVTILLGIILYLIMIDQKVSDIEKKLKK